LGGPWGLRACTWPPLAAMPTSSAVLRGLAQAYRCNRRALHTSRQVVSSAARTPARTARSRTLMAGAGVIDLTADSDPDSPEPGAAKPARRAFRSHLDAAQPAQAVGA